MKFWRTDWRTEISRLKMIVCISCDNFVFLVKIYQVDNVLKLLFSTAGQIRQEMTWPFVSLDFSSFSPKTLSTCEILSHCLRKVFTIVRRVHCSEYVFQLRFSFPSDFVKQAPHFFICRGQEGRKEVSIASGMCNTHPQSIVYGKYSSLFIL